jgi:hypothetical protein
MIHLQNVYSQNIYSRNVYSRSIYSQIVYAAYTVTKRILYRTYTEHTVLYCILPDFLSLVFHTLYIALKRILIEKFCMEAAARAALSCGSSCG